LEDPSRRLPIFCRAADWKAKEDESVVEWLDRSTALLPTADLRAALDGGRVALFVDGLDELGSRVIRLEAKEMIDPRKALLAKLPEEISALVTSRSDVLEEIGGPRGFGIFDVEPITDEQIAQYLAEAPKLADLLTVQPSLRELVRTPLALGLLSFIANTGQVCVDDVPGVGQLSPRLRVVNDFAVSRWQHESSRGTDLALIRELVAVLGRVATLSGQAFTEGDLRDAAAVDAIDATSVLRSAVQLGFVRPTAEGEYAFFHPSFAEYYATVHCRRYLGDQSPDGWDIRLFDRIGQLGDPSFIPTLVVMEEGGGFWRGEFSDEIAATLNSIDDPGNPDVVKTLLHLAGDNGLRGSGMIAVCAFARRCKEELKAQFINQLSSKVGTDSEVVHHLLGFGEPGIEALLRAHKQLDDDDPMRRQIESYSIVRQRLGLRDLD
jgi:hypothetical protein